MKNQTEALPKSKAEKGSAYNVEVQALYLEKIHSV
jgi:hypothetical protein